MPKRLDAEIGNVWHDVARKLYVSGMSLGKTYEELRKQFPVSFCAMRSYLQSLGVTRPMRGGLAKCAYARSCVCGKPFMAKSPTTLMCDDCAGDNRLKAYCRWRHSQGRLTQHGVDQAKFDSMMDVQRGKCGLCERSLDPPCLDHDHTTGVVRGLLCNRCNLLLGQVEIAGGSSWLDKAESWLRKG